MSISWYPDIDFSSQLFLGIICCSCSIICYFILIYDSLHMQDVIHGLRRSKNWNLIRKPLVLLSFHGGRPAFWLQDMLSFRTNEPYTYLHGKQTSIVTLQ
jgi:hypothetical protein